MGSVLLTWLIFLCLRSACGSVDQGTVPGENCRQKDLEKVFNECFEAFTKLRSTDLSRRLQDCCVSFGTEKCFRNSLGKMQCHEDAMSIAFLQENRLENCHLLHDTCSKLLEFKRIFLSQALNLKKSRSWTFEDPDKTPSNVRDPNEVDPANEDEVPRNPEHETISKHFGKNDSVNEDDLLPRYTEPVLPGHSNESQNESSTCSVNSSTCSRESKMFSEFTVAVNSGGIAVNDSAVYDPRQHAVNFSAEGSPKVTPSRSKPNISNPVDVISSLLNSTNSSDDPIQIVNTTGSEQRETGRNTTDSNSTSQTEPRESAENDTQSNSTSLPNTGERADNVTTSNSTVPEQSTGSSQDTANLNSTGTAESRQNSSNEVSQSTSQGSTERANATTNTSDAVRQARLLNETTSEQINTTYYDENNEKLEEKHGSVDTNTNRSGCPYPCNPLISESNSSTDHNTTLSLSDLNGIFTNGSNSSRNPEREGRSRSSLYEFQLNDQNLDLMRSIDNFRKLNYNLEDRALLEVLTVLQQIVTKICSSPDSPCSNRREARQDWANWLNSFNPSTTTTTVKPPAMNISAATPDLAPLLPTNHLEINLMPGLLGNSSFNFSNPLLLLNTVAAMEKNMTSNSTHDPIGPESGDATTTQSTNDHFFSSGPALPCLKSVILSCFLLSLLI